MDQEFIDKEPPNNTLTIDWIQTDDHGSGNERVDQNHKLEMSWRGEVGRTGLGTDMGNLQRNHSAYGFKSKEVLINFDTRNHRIQPRL